MKVIDPMNDPRVAGQVTRYHTWPRLRQQSVAEHTWQVIRILLTIWPDAPRRLLLYAMRHDIGELHTGDPPFPIKRDNPVLKSEMDRLEIKAQDAIASTWDMGKIEGASEFELAVFKLAEFIEMWEYGLHEMNLGNQYAALVVERCVFGLGQFRDKIRSNYMLAGNHNNKAVAEDVLKRTNNYVNRRSDQENV